METINRTARGIALVVDSDGRLLDTITDGDLRRAILNGTNLDLPVATLGSRRTSAPVTAAVGTAPRELIKLLRSTKLRHVPLVDSAGVVRDVAILDELVDSGSPEHDEPKLTAVVMAGGMGKRLLPLTAETPKPMLPLGEKPVVEHMVEKLRAAGIRQLVMATHYRADALSSHFGDGSAFGMEIRYADEEVPLGTAGALGKLNQKEPLLVVNGDIVTDLNYRAMFDFHREQGAEMTVGVRHYEFNVPYGVVHTQDAAVTHIAEKPTQRMFVNAGIYLVEPAACARVPQDRRFDMTELIADLIAEKRRVVAFPICEYWVDIGRPEDYEEARARASAIPEASR
jgi:dTDP-glucose pyrophosphorylase